MPKGAVIASGSRILFSRGSTTVIPREERRGKGRKGMERKGMERRGKKRKGKERKGKESYK